MYPHRIQLRGPWDYEIIDPSTGQSIQTGRLNIPTRLSDCFQQGLPARICLRRRFGKPRRLDSGEKVWLLLPGNPSILRVRVNDSDLDPVQCADEFEITPHLAERNVLEIELGNVASEEWLREATLEIRREAFLRDVHVRQLMIEGQSYLEATGFVAGAWETSLELYLLSDRHTMAYQIVEAGEQDRPFRLASDLGTVGGSTARIELIAGSSLWYATNVDIEKV